MTTDEQTSGWASPFTVRVPKMAELVADHIRGQIVRGELNEGDALRPESSLVEDFTVSRPTLREAFRILESEGLITVRRGANGGARVHVPSTEVVARYAGFVMQHRGVTLADLLEARVLVESPAARMLARRPDCAAIGEKLRQFLDTIEPLDTRRYHEFNAYVIELTGNETLMLITAMLEHVTVTAAINFVAVNSESSRSLATKAHRLRKKFADLVGEGKADEAEALWKRDLVEGGRIIGEQVGTIVDVFGRSRTGGVVGSGVGPNGAAGPVRQPAPRPSSLTR